MGTVQYVGRSSEGKDYRNSALGPRIPATKLALAQCVNGLMCNGHFRKPLLGSGLTHHSQDLKKKKSNWEKQILQILKKKKNQEVLSRSLQFYFTPCPQRCSRSPEQARAA